MATFQERIGRRVKSRRALLGMSQPELAEKTGIPQEHISRYERGVFTSVNPERLVQLAQALGVTTDYLLGLAPDEEDERPRRRVVAAVH